MANNNIYKSDDKVLRSLYGDVSVPEVSLHEHILKNAARFGDKIAMIDINTKRQYTYAQFVNACHQSAAALYKHGVRQGDIVLLISPNDIDYGVAICAVISLGGTVTTVNPASTAGELAVQLEDSDASWVITGASVADKAKEVAAKFANVKETFSFGEVQGCTPFSQLIKEGGPEPPKIVIDLHNDVILLPYSSGTTGKPKGVMLTHHNIMANLEQIAPDMIGMDRGEGSETYIAFLPFYHIYGMVVLLYSGLSRGHKLAVVPRFGVEEYLTAIQEYKGTVLHIVPPVAVLLAKHPVVDKFDLSSAHEIFCGAAPMSKELGEAIQKRLNIDVIRQGYGMTELSPVCHISPKEGWKHGSAGLVVTGSECRVVDNDGKNLGPGEDGEIWIKGPQVMKGYYKRPDATASTIDSDGWLHTGDIGHYDEGGHFVVVDRLKELIKYKGFQVAPAEVEATILTHPAVADVCVVGLLDEEAGELPMAFVVKKEDIAVEADDIIKFVHERVSPHKRLRGGVQFTDKIPKSPSGKILRRILRDQAREQFGSSTSTKM